MFASFSYWEAEVLIEPTWLEPYWQREIGFLDNRVGWDCWLVAVVGVAASRALGLVGPQPKHLNTHTHTLTHS